MSKTFSLLKIEEYQFPYSKGGGNWFLFERFIAKQMKNFETINAKTICLELTIVKKKWCILFAYRPPKTNKEEFCDEISASLIKALSKYEYYSR